MPSLRSLFQVLAAACTAPPYSGGSRFVGSNLDPAMFGLDAGLQRRYAGMPGVTYVSMIGPLCHDGACLAYLDGDRKEKLMTYDYAHFTLPASEFVVRTVVYPAMSGLLN